MIDLTDDRALTAMARQVARRYKARAWWADVDDLVQEAWVAIASARRTFDPALAGAGGFEAYAQRAIVRWLRGYLWRTSKPVSVSSHTLQQRADLDQLRGIVMESLDALHESAGKEAAGHPDLERRDMLLLRAQRQGALPTPAAVEERIDEALWAREARAAIDEAFEDLDRGDAALAEDLLRRETMPAEAAQEARRPVQSVYRLRDGAYRRLASSPAVHAVWAARRAG